MAMGAANVIPGVSGGTIAFITGIYERLISAIKNIDLDALRLLFTGRLGLLSTKIDLTFLTMIALGVVISILSLARLLEYTFVYYESFTLAFFFGLILASVIGVGRQIEVLNLAVLISFLTGLIIAGSIAFLPPAESNDSFFYMMLCGAVAVCSMVLPGLSGSYVLLLMGNYILVLQAIYTFDFYLLIPLLLGCLVGLIAFARLLSYLFAHYKDQTIGLLTGFVAGSLLIIWPWKTTRYMKVMGDKEKAVGYDWNLPLLDLDLLLSIFLMIVGFVLVWWMERYSKNRS